jgi:hypothetical protein
MDRNNERLISASSPNPGDIAILLTATIDVRGVSFMQRTDPLVRRRDYERALKLWLASAEPARLVFCENSGADLGSLIELSKTHNPHSKAVEFLSFDDNNYPRGLGKGFGEIRTIAYAIEHSKIIGTETLIFKVTGRHYISNIAGHLNGILARGRADVYCDLRGNLTWADTRAFCASSSFLKKYLIALQCIADDARGINIEHVLARGTNLCLAEGGRWSLLPHYLDIRGVSGTGGMAYPASFYSRIKRTLFHRLKFFSFKRGLQGVL